MTNTGPFFHQKSNFSLISDTPSVGGCWGQLILFFWKMVVVPKKKLYLSIPEPISNQIYLAYLYLSDPIHKCHFNMRYPKISVLFTTMRKYNLLLRIARHQPGLHFRRSLGSWCRYCCWWTWFLAKFHLCRHTIGEISLIFWKKFASR